MFNPFRRKPPMRAAGAYLHPDTWIIHAEHRTTAGVLMSNPPVFRMPLSAATSQLGLAVRQALEGYRENVPHPTDWKNAGAEFLKLTGFKSWRALEAPSKSCWISESGGELVFTPLRNGGTAGDKKGFQPFGAVPLRVPAAPSDEQLGQALMETLAVSIGAV
jgi:hypothetical protein